MTRVAEFRRWDSDHEATRIALDRARSRWSDWGGMVSEYTMKIPANCQSLRLVVQHICESPSERSWYRLVGYSDEHTYRPVDFHTRADLLRVLKEALPDFDASRVPERIQPVSSILFADVMELSETQRSILGLKAE